MAMRWLFLVAGAAATNSTDGAGDVVLAPTGAGKAVGLIMLPGAQITETQYQPLLEQVQAAAAEKGVALYVCILHYWLGLTQPADLSYRVDYAQKQLYAKGLKSTDPMFYAGHSLGGVFIQDFVHGLEGKAAGQILMGSYLVRKYRETGYPVPTLTVGGELDGQSRITRIAESWYHSHSDAQFPVVVVPGICHMSFASGPAPGFVKGHDLTPEVEEPEAHQRIAAVVAGYLAGESLQAHLDETQALVAPIVQAYEYEGSRSFDVPAQFGGPDEKQCKRGLCPAKSPWVPVAQQVVAGDVPGYTLDISDAYVDLTGSPVTGKDFHLPTISNDSSKTISVTTYAQGYWGNSFIEIFNSFDTAFEPTSCLEIGAKLASRQCIHIRGAGQTDTPFSVDSPDLCAQANAKAYAWAKEKAGQHTLARFEQRGKPLEFGKDVLKAGGPLWANARLQMNDQGDHVEVVSAAQVTEIDYWKKHFPFPRPSALPDPGCYHYCKLLSPARAMEWIYVDGLRKSKSASVLV